MTDLAPRWPWLFATWMVGLTFAGALIFTIGNYWSHLPVAPGLADRVVQSTGVLAAAIAAFALTKVIKRNLDRADPPSFRPAEAIFLIVNALFILVYLFVDARNKQPSPTAVAAMQALVRTAWGSLIALSLVGGKGPLAHAAERLAS